MNIQEQIRDLTEKLSNLFEVEGIGEPAYEVPPSTNKIKKDVKTKDGKVELVSVEDELFPKDGNKREQFRQKVIDTINGMIQGTATLEDLLQVVRSKQTKVVKEGFEGAIEILEDVVSMIRKQPIEDQSALLYKYHQAKHKENAGKDTYTLGREEEKRKSKEEKGQEKTEQRKKYRGTSTEDWKLGRLMDQIARNAKNLGKTKDPATAKAIRRNAQKEALKEAQELLEDLYTKIKKEHGEPKYAGIDSHPANKSAELIHKMSDAKGKEYAEEKEKNPDINLYNKRYTTKNTRGEQKTQNRSSEYRKFSDDWRLPKTDDEKITASIRRNKLKPVKEALSEVQKILELFDRPDLLNDIDNALGSPVKKFVKNILAGKKKEKKVKINK